MGYDTLGEHLTSALVGDGHRVTVLDACPERLGSLPQGPEGTEAVYSGGSLMEVLRELDINNVDAFLAVSEDDNRNLLAAQVASHIFHIPQVICRVDDPERGKSYSQLGMTVICPTLVAADSIMKALRA